MLSHAVRSITPAASPWPLAAALALALGAWSSPGLAASPHPPELDAPVTEPGPPGNIPFLSLPGCLGVLPGFEAEWWYYVGDLHSATGATFTLQVEALRVQPLDPAPDHQIGVGLVAIGCTLDQSYLWSQGYGLGAGPDLPGGSGMIVKAGRDQYEVTLNPVIGYPVPAQAMAQKPARVQFLYTGGAPVGIRGSRYTLAAEGVGGLRLPSSPVEGTAQTYAFNLSVVDQRGMVLEGQSGYVASPTLQTYEFAQPHLEVTGGTLTLGGVTFVLDGGHLWLDRQGLHTVSPPSAQASRPLYLGTWMGLQLQNGICMDLESFWQPSTPQWRTGSLLGLPPLAGSFGNLFYPVDGRKRPSGSAYLYGLEGDTYDFDVNVLQGPAPPSWTSPVSGHTYATSWQVRFGPGYAAELGLDTLYLHALVPGCENLLPDLGNAYWEGAVSISSDPEGRTVVGHGFVEQMGFN